MPTKPVIFSKSDVELQPSPIKADWIVEGRPVARNAILSRSEDQTACTIVWDCSKGKFNWYYDFDETVHFIEAVACDRPVLVTAEQARQVMEVYIAADISAERNEPVNLPLPESRGLAAAAGAR